MVQAPLPGNDVPVATATERPRAATSVDSLASALLCYTDSAGFTKWGKGERWEKVAGAAKRYLDAEVPVGENLCDQLLLLLALLPAARPGQTARTVGFRSSIPRRW